VAPLQHSTVFADQCKRPLLQSKRGAFLDSDLRPFAVPPERREHGDVEHDRLVHVALPVIA